MIGRVGGELLVLLMNACFGKGQSSPCGSGMCSGILNSLCVLSLSLSFLLHISLFLPIPPNNDSNI